MSIRRGKITESPNSFEKFDHHTEWSAAIMVIEWANEIIRELNLPLGSARGEKRGIDGKRPDILIYESPQSTKTICVLEFKPPYFDPFNEEELKEPARQKASRRGAPYFCTCNFKQLIWFNTERVNRLEPEEKQIVEKYELSAMEDLDAIEEPRFKSSVKRNLERFLRDLVEISSGKKPEPLLPIDEFLIYRLQQKIKVLQIHYKKVVEDEIKSPEFAKKLQKWFIEQAWTFAWQDADYEKAARQAAYLLVNKILFYNVLQSKRKDLDPLEIPKSLTKSGLLQKTLQNYFDYVLRNIDYETIYSTDFIDQLAFPDNKDVVEEVKELIEILNRYNFAQLGFDVIGRIFEKLIPTEERHVLGQYFTNPDVVDAILKFCLKKENDKVLDPACGAGTFLVRAYQHKKGMNPRLSHEEILETLWGNDIAKFPAHLTTINLAINDLTVEENYPRVIQKDFFDLLPEKVEFKLPEKWREVTLKGLGEKEKAIIHPRWFDCVVGNPPYTRQEEIADMTGQGIGYKERLIKKALYKLGPKTKENTLAQISKRAGIHAYFFVHGFKFLYEGGRFGFVVSSSWLDVDYGKGLQEFFLNNYKVVTILESKVERWFEDADINTCIVILEKCTSSKKERDENLVRFVQLKKPLRHFIPLAENMWEKQVKRLEEIDKLIKTILGHSDYYENEELKIFPKKQSELWEEGFDFERNKYVGSKWGKYLRAPEIFFKILEKGKDKLVPLKHVADVRFGIKTGANEFFYLTEEEIKKRGIEKEFWMHKDEKGKWAPNYVIERALESKKPEIDLSALKKRVLFIHKSSKELKNAKVLSYIKSGERSGYNKRPTCASREPTRSWYDLGENINDIIAFPERVRLRHLILYNPERISLNKNLYGIETKDDTIAKVLAILLNSTLTSLYLELFARQPGGGGGPLDIDVYVAKDIPILNEILIKNYSSRLFRVPLLSRKIESIFQEIGASSPEEVSLDTVNSSRRKLDEIIMGEILGLTREERLEVYRAVVDLVKSRIEKAKSFGKRKKTKEGLDIELLTKTILERIGKNNLAKFYKEKILSQQIYHRDLPKPSDAIKIENTLLGWELVSRKEKIECLNETQARYLKVWLEAGLGKVAVPVEIKYLDTVIDELESIMSHTKKVINEYLSSIFDRKTRERILHRVWQEVLKSLVKSK